MKFRVSKQLCLQTKLYRKSMDKSFLTKFIFLTNKIASNLLTFLIDPSNFYQRGTRFSKPRQNQDQQKWYYQMTFIWIFEYQIFMVSNLVTNDIKHGPVIFISPFFKPTNSSLHIERRTYFQSPVLKAGSTETQQNAFS